MAKQKWYRFYIYLLLELVRSFFFILPRGCALRLAEGVGFAIYRLVPKHRHRTQAHLRYAFGAEWSEAKTRKISRRVYGHVAKTVADVCRFPKMTEDRLRSLVTFDDRVRIVESVQKQGRGVILLTAHLGNWELIGPFTRRVCGYEGCVVGRRIYYERFNRILISLRESGLIKTIYRDESPRALLEALKRKHVVGILPDQDVDSVDGVFVPFFGRDAWTPTAPAKLAMASGAAIVPMFMIRQKDRYQLFVEEPIWPPERGSKSKDRAVEAMTVAWAKVVERYIKNYPEQWVWMHDRWKTRVEHDQRDLSHKVEVG